MIHIATVHWQNALWIDIQLDYFARYITDEPFRIYAFLNGVDPEKYRSRIHAIFTEPIQPHITKLNLLADRICENGDPGDTIYFIDGDAFPVGDIHKYVSTKFHDTPLVAIQRLENRGDPQPHPSFCATTIGFWKNIKGDWGQGPQWKTSDGDFRTDTGGILWKKLNDKGIEWTAMHRSNQIDLHPVWFGIYENLIYHHGAGFRTPFCRVDIRDAREVWWKRWIMGLADSRIGIVGGEWFQMALYSFAMRERIRKTLRDSKILIDHIQQDPMFKKCFYQSQV